MNLKLLKRLALVLTAGLALMDVGWIAPWAVLIGAWSAPARPRPLLSAPSILLLVLLGALTTRLLGRRAAARRSVQVGVAGLGLVAVLIGVRVDQFPDANGLDWLGFTAVSVALALGQFSGPALAFALGLFVWWRGIRLGGQTASFAEAESAFHWGIGLLVAFALLMALTTRPILMPALEAQTTPLVVGFFFVSLLTLALGRLESLRTRTLALPVNTQWLGVLIAVAGLVIVLALVIGQLLSFDLLMVATRPLFDLLGRVVMLAIYIVVIPLAYLVEWLVYLLLGLLRGNGGQRPPLPLQPADVDNRLQSFSSLAVPPQVLVVLEASGAAVLLVVALLFVARAASRWRLANTDAEATDEQRESVWEPGRFRRLLLAWLRRLFRRFQPTPSVSATEASAGSAGAPMAGVSSIRELYRELLRLGDVAGVHRGPATTPLEHLPPLQASLEPADDLARLTQAYLRVRYADAEPTPAEAGAARGQLDRLRVRPGPPDLVKPPGA